METNHRDSSWNIASLDSRFRICLLACLLAILSYLAARLGRTLEILPQADWPLWPGNVLVASVLLLVPRRIWPNLMAAAFAAFVLFNLQSGVPIRSIVLLLLSDSIEILTVALGLRYSFDGVPQLNSVKALAKYSFFGAFLAPSAGAIFGAFATSGNYWTSWRISFFSEAIAYLTIMPAILGWVSQARAWARASRAYYLEATVLIATIISLSYFVFVAPRARTLPALLYFLVPFLLWSALRFGSAGAGTSATIVAFLSVWGAAHGRGPFTETAPINNVLWLQLFLLSTAVPFMVLAALVGERKQAEEELRESEERLGGIVASAMDAIVAINDAQQIVLFNASAEKMFGCRAQDAIGSPIERFIPQRFRAGHGTHIRHFGETGVTSRAMGTLGALRALRTNGDEFPIEASISHVNAAGKKLFTVIIRDITDRRRGEEALRESEERFRLVADTAPVLIWMSGANKLCTFFNKGWLDFTGRSMEQELGEGWTFGVHPDDLKQCLGIYSAAFDAREDFEMEYRLRRFDGEYRWIVDHGVPGFESNGAFCGYIGSCVDMTDRKLSETSLRELSGRLIHAQEEERARIARELHDDLSQRMALLSIRLAQFEQGMPDISSEARQQLHKIAEAVTEVSCDIHNLSHQLHPSKLDTLGLVAAVEGLCRELSKQHDLRIRFVHYGVPVQIPKEVTLCLFRIVQEALRNVVKHSGAAKAEVELSGHADEIDLCISDAGKGFNGESVKVDGLGLISMRERLRLVGGHLSIESEPSHGTQIRVRIPGSRKSIPGLTITEMDPVPGKMP